MTRFTYDENILSDLYKDVYGVRPRQPFYAHWNSLTPAEKQEKWDDMCGLLDRELEREREAESRAYDRWSSWIAKLMAELGINKATAIRADMDAEDCVNDVGYYCYKSGMSYSVENEINKVLADN